MENEKSEIRYRCYWCGYVLNEDKIIIKDKAERDKYGTLPTTYCIDCNKVIMTENNL